MNWKRGLLLAAINLAIAMPVVLSTQARTEKYSREHPRFEAPRTPQENSEPGDERVALDPCEGIVEYPPPIVVVRLSNLPVAVVTGWASLCSPRWTISARLGLNRLTAHEVAELPALRIVDTTFLILIPIQWFLTGAFPLVRPKLRLAEPGMFITFCAAIGAFLALFPSLESLPELPAALAGIMWLLWFGWLLWKTIRLAWRSAVRLLPQSAL